MNNNKTALTSLTADEISSAAGVGQKYRGKQILEWIIKGAVSFDEMTNLPASLRDELESSCNIYSTEIKDSRTDEEGTSKILIELEDGFLIEAVLLTDERGRKTACLSSQAGCAVGCKFCRTGTMGLQRNLSAGEIIEQYLHLSRLYGTISNIVYMGMGEPFHNLDAVIKSLKLFTDSRGFAMSPRRVTLSTCGLVEGIYRIIEEAPPVRLAISLVTADEKNRNALIPVSTNNSLKMLREALLHYQRVIGRRITLECVIIRDVNDKASDAALIADWACGLNVNVNVIPWNPAAELNFKEPEKSSVESFCRELERRGTPVSRRYRRGRGLNAACGQLAADSSA